MAAQTAPAVAERPAGRRSCHSSPSSQRRLMRWARWSPDSCSSRLRRRRYRRRRALPLRTEQHRGHGSTPRLNLSLEPMRGEPPKHCRYQVRRRFAHRQCERRNKSTHAGFTRCAGQTSSHQGLGRAAFVSCWRTHCSVTAASRSERAAAAASEPGCGRRVAQWVVRCLFAVAGVIEALPRLEPARERAPPLPRRRARVRPLGLAGTDAGRPPRR